MDEMQPKKQKGLAQQHRRRRVNVFCVEGNIGAGKSSMLWQLKGEHFTHAHVCLEPTNKWGDSLNDMYDGTLSKPVFQMMAATTRWAELMRVLLQSSVDCIIMERSPWSDAKVFKKINVTREADIKAYDRLHECIVDVLADPAIDVEVVWHMILLDVDVDVAKTRIIKRDRAGEIDAAADAEWTSYMEQLRDAHEKMFDECTWPKVRIAVSSVNQTEAAALAADALNVMMPASPTTVIA